MGALVIEFVGREQELNQLSWLLDQVRGAVGGRAPGQCVQMRGRRRIGKSSLVEEFLRRSGAPAVFFTAERRAAEDELVSFWRTVVGSGVDDRGFAGGVTPSDWSGALSTLGYVLPEDRPTVVVIDELPYLVERVDAFEGILQRAWDRELSRKPVLLVLVGSDLGMMAALNSYDRPFHQRGREMVIGPLNPAEVADMVRLDPADAFDAALVTGGLPLNCAEWEAGAAVWDYLEQAISNPLSALLVSAERVLAAEFPQQAQARTVLAAIGSGERGFSNIARAAGGMPHTSLVRALEPLVAKGVVNVEEPLSTRPATKSRHYQIADPYLRFWLTFVEPNLPLIERRRADLALDRIRAGWTAWRGRVIEPLVRESLARLLPAHGIPAAAEVGSYWTRSNDVEIDIVGADRAPVAQRLHFLGSIKWLEQRPFDAHDLGALAAHRDRLPGADPTTPLLAVSRSGTAIDGITTFGPEELLVAWR